MASRSSRKDAADAADGDAGLDTGPDAVLDGGLDEGSHEAPRVVSGELVRVIPPGLESVNTALSVVAAGGGTQEQAGFALTTAEEVLQGFALKGRVVAPGVQVVYEFGELAPGLCIAVAAPDSLREPDVNARLMAPEMFAQLTENVKRWQRLESLPYCVLSTEQDRTGQDVPSVKIVSGTKRVRAARAAGLGMIPVLLDELPLNDNQRLAKQIAHNAIQGTDDTETLRQLVAAITSVDELVEAYAPAQLVAPPDLAIEPVLAPSIQVDWRTVTFAFLPHHLDDFKALLDEVKHAKPALVGAANVELYEPFTTALAAFGTAVEVKNSGVALALLVEAARQFIGDEDETGAEGAGAPAKNGAATVTEETPSAAPTGEIADGTAPGSDDVWVPLASIFGRAAVPRGAAKVIQQAVERMLERDQVSPNARWAALEYWAADYLSGA